MPSAWIAKRRTRAGETRYRVMYRVGGRESAPRYAGSFSTQREAKTRQGWVRGELAAMRIPDLELLAGAPKAPTVREVAQRWRESRVDVSDGTRLQHRSAIAAMLPLIGDRRIDAITVADVTDVVAALAAKGRKRETIRKTTLVLGMILRYAGRGWTEA